MKKIITIIALFIFTSMSGLSFAEKKEGVSLKFVDSADNQSDKKQSATTLSGKNTSGTKTVDKPVLVNPMSEQNH